jgi:hypothetical protein
VTVRKPYLMPDSFASLVAAIQEGSERKIEGAVDTIARAVKANRTTTTTRRKPARKPT